MAFFLEFAHMIPHAVADAVDKLPPHIAAFGEDRCIYCGRPILDLEDEGSRGCEARRRVEREEQARGGLP